MRAGALIISEGPPAMHWLNSKYFDPRRRASVMRTLANTEWTSIYIWISLTSEVLIIGGAGRFASFSAIQLGGRRRGSRRSLHGANGANRCPSTPKTPQGFHFWASYDGNIRKLGLWRAREARNRARTGKKLAVFTVRLDETRLKGSEACNISAGRRSG